VAPRSPASLKRGKPVEETTEAEKPRTELKRGAADTDKAAPVSALRCIAAAAGG
jgi:hypothetical protein